MADDDGKAKLFRHVRLGKTKEVKEALTTGALGVNEQDSKGDTLLHLAARNGHKPIVKELLRRNCDFDAKNVDGKQAWELAYEFNYADLGGYIRDKTGLPPLDASAKDSSAPAQSGGDDDGLLDLLDLGPADKTEKRNKQAGRSGRERDGDPSQKLPEVDLKKSGFDPLGSVGLPKKPFDPLGGGGHRPPAAEPVGKEPGREQDKATGAGREPERERDRDAVVGGRDAGDSGRNSSLSVHKAHTWQERVDFSLLKSALKAVAEGSRNVPNAAALNLDTAFWAQIESVKEATGLPAVEERARGLEELMGKLWGRYAVFKAEDVQGVRLQSEVRGLVAKMGAGADLDSVLEERDRLRIKQGDAERQVADLAAKMRLLENEVRESGTRLEEARREAEDQQAKLRAERRGREAGDAKCRELESARDDLEREVREAKDAAAAEKRAVQGLRGDLNKVRDIKVGFLSAAELDDLFRRHDRDNSGDISPEEMKPMVEELCSVMDRRMEAARGELHRERSRAEQAEVSSHVSSPPIPKIPYPKP